MQGPSMLFPTEDWSAQPATENWFAAPTAQATEWSRPLPTTNDVDSSLRKSQFFLFARPPDFCNSVRMLPDNGGF
ncbi:hypothetical protein GH733_013634 [Mirounga leonina]|nr:hypothetical protein GH733_013634 [Mirounga leonina]